MSTHLQIAGFNPLRGQTMNDYGFDEELGSLAGDMIRSTLRKRLIKKYPAKSNAEITDLVNLGLLYQSYAKSGSPKAVREMARYWNLNVSDNGPSMDGLSGPLAANYTRDFLQGKRPWPGMHGMPAPQAKHIAPIMPTLGRFAAPKLTTKGALMHIVRAEKVKKAKAKREAGCPCKAREHAQKQGGRELRFPPAVEEGLKSVLGHLRYSAMQRKATSEHRGLSAQESFRRRVIDMLQACDTARERDGVVRVILSRG